MQQILLPRVRLLAGVPFCYNKHRTHSDIGVT
jgi:hypothetical protein